MPTEKLREGGSYRKRGTLDGGSYTFNYLPVVQICAESAITAEHRRVSTSSGQHNFDLKFAQLTGNEFGTLPIQVSEDHMCPLERFDHTFELTRPPENHAEYVQCSRFME